MSVNYPIHIRLDIVSYYTVVLFIGLSLYSSPCRATTLAQLPEPRNTPVVDIPDVINDSEEQQLIDKITKLKQATGDDIRVVIVPNITEPGVDAKQFAVKLFENWKIGTAKQDNGFLILLDMQTHRIEMETGYGLEGTLPDATLQRIRQNTILPKFKKGLYGQGLIAGVDAISDRLEANSPDKRIQKIQDNHKAKWLDNLLTIWLFFLIILPISRVRSILNTRLNLFEVYHAQVSHEQAVQAIDLYNKNLTPHQNRDSENYFVTILIITLLAALIAFFSSLTVWQSIWLGLAALIFINIYFVIKYLTNDKTKMSYWRTTGVDLPHFHDITLRAYEIHWLLVTLLSPFYGILAYVLERYLKNRWRNSPRTCQNCQGNMIKLSAVQAKDYLNHLQTMNIKEGYADYDVWQCNQSKDICILRYELKEDERSFTYCPQCQTRAYQLVDIQTLKPSTTVAAGEGSRVYCCLNCGYEATESYIIPIIMASNTTDKASNRNEVDNFSSRSDVSSRSDYDNSESDGRSGGGGGGDNW